MDKKTVNIMLRMLRRRLVEIKREVDLFKLVEASSDQADTLAACDELYRNHSISANNYREAASKIRLINSLIWELKNRSNPKKRGKKK